MAAITSTTESWNNHLFSEVETHIKNNYLTNGAGSYTPTLSSAPTTSTKTYTKDGVTYNFIIGQFCRVADASSQSGYVFYQLQNLNNGSAVWIAFIVKLNPSYTPPTARALTYNASSQNTLNAGSTSDGTILYSSNGTTWSSDVPKETNAGTYTKYWRLIGDDAHLDVAPTSISVTVAKADQAAPTATGASVPEGSTATATASGGGGHGSLTWSNGNTRTALGSQTTKAKWSGDSNYNASPWSNEVTLEVINAHMGHEYVDLGLPSGTKWAKTNVGASSETEYGNYYQYGKGASTFMQTHTQPYYSGTENPLSSNADTATQSWGGNWHMPTQTQFTELIANCTWEWTTVNGVNGWSVSNNGKSIFIPANGYYFTNNYSDYELQSVNSACVCWTSTYNQTGNVPNVGCYFYATNKTKATPNTGSLLWGNSVRPVIG